MRLSVLAVAALPFLAACQDLAAPAGPTTGQRAPSPSDVAAAAIPPLGRSLAYLCSDGTVVRASYFSQGERGTMNTALGLSMVNRSSAVLDINGERVGMIQGASANGTRYIGGGYEWTTRGLQLATLAPVGPDGRAAEGVACRSNG